LLHMTQLLKDGLGQAWNLMTTFVPKFVGFLIIVSIGRLIAKAVFTLKQSKPDIPPRPPTSVDRQGPFRHR
jgi:hypothetical protein